MTEQIEEKTNDMKAAVAGVVAIVGIGTLAVIVSAQMGIEMSESTVGMFMAAITGIVALAKT